MSRARALELAQMMVVDGILEDLNGSGRPACKRGALKNGFCDDPPLGDMKKRCS